MAWDSNSDTLTLDSSYSGGGINIFCATTDTIALTFTGPITIDGGSEHAIYCDGNLTINGTDRLELESSHNYGTLRGRTITIASGTVVATNSTTSAIVGQNGLTISGTANVTATAGGDGAGLNSTFGAMTISTTGTVTATANGTGPALYNGSDGGINIGSGIVYLKSSGGNFFKIQMPAGATPAINNCIVFENNTGTVHGNVTLTNDFTLDSVQTLTIPPSASLTVPSGKTLTNDGTLTNNSTINNSGTLTNVNGGTINNKAAKPTATPTGGTRTGPVNVMLACTSPGAAIHYTTDGTTTPTNASPVYSTPISISSTTTLKAVAVVSGWGDSDEMTETYTISSSGGGGDTPVTPPSPSAKSTDVTSVKVTIGGTTYEGTVDGDKITLDVPAGTDVSKLNIAIAGYPGAKVTPAPPYDFTKQNPITITVTSPDGTKKKEYTLTVNVAAPQPVPTTILNALAPGCTAKLTQNADGTWGVEILIPFASGFSPAEIETIAAALSGLSNVRFFYVDENGTATEISVRKAGDKSLKITGTAANRAALANVALTGVSVWKKNDATEYRQSVNLKLSDVPGGKPAEERASRGSSSGCDAGAMGLLGLALCGAYLWRKRG